MKLVIHNRQLKMVQQGAVIGSVFAEVAYPRKKQEFENAENSRRTMST